MPSYVLPVCVCEAFASPHVHLPTLRDAFGPSIYTLEDPVKLALKPMAPSEPAKTKEALAHARAMLEHAAAAIATVKEPAGPRPPPPPTRVPTDILAPAPEKRHCNRHDDCAAADAKAKERHEANIKKPWGERMDTRPYVDHCHSDDCEDCFGS
jgi:hypothetical protein